MGVRRFYWLVFSALILGSALLAASPALAAVPSFTMEIAPDPSGIEVTVTFEPVPTGFNWASMEESGIFEALVGVLPADKIDDRGRPVPDAAPEVVELTRVSEGVYRGSIALADGRWAVFPYPLSAEFDPAANPGAASTKLVTVGAPLTATTLSVLTIGLVAVGVLAMIWRRAA